MLLVLTGGMKEEAEIKTALSNMAAVSAMHLLSTCKMAGKNEVSLC